VLINDQLLNENCLFRKIQRSPRPGLKQNANQKSGQLNRFRRRPPGLPFGDLPFGATATLKESKLYRPQGQYFFWEPVNNDIPETEFPPP
jgi:hypothetical protein